MALSLEERHKKVKEGAEDVLEFNACKEYNYDYTEVKETERIEKIRALKPGESALVMQLRQMGKIDCDYLRNCWAAIRERLGEGYDPHVSVLNNRASLVISRRL